MKHPSPWTLEGRSVLDRTVEDEGIAAEEARCDHSPYMLDMLVSLKAYVMTIPRSCVLCMLPCASSHFARHALDQHS